MTEFVSIKFTSLRGDMDKLMHKLDGFIKELHVMETWFGESLAIDILVASIEVPKQNPTLVTIKLLADKDVNSEDASAKHIDKEKTLKQVF